MKLRRKHRNREGGPTGRLFALTCALALSLSAGDLRGQRPTINGHPVDPKIFRLLIEHRFLPTRNAFMSNVEIAQKLDLELPQLAEIKAALVKKNAHALEKGLVAYLNGKLPPLKPSVDTPRAPISPSQEQGDAWLGKELTFNVNGELQKYPIGDKIDWFKIGDGLPDIAGWSSWGNALAQAYLAGGDIKYARGLLGYVRAFYRDCRPPLSRPTSWDGSLGPWAVGGRGRAMGLLQWIYQILAAAPVTTDADRLMFLKMIYEHAEAMQRMSEEHQISNFEFYPISTLALLARQFPEFKESQSWQGRATERVLENMEDAVLDDGGVQERSQYNGAYLSSYTQFYRSLPKSGALPEFRRKLETMYEWFMWMLSPLGQYPSLNIGSLNDLSSYVEPAAELFPERPDLVFLATNRTRGVPPIRTARVLAHTGFLTMRSDWSADALYMALNYNGSMPEIPGTNPDLLSFGIWAHGRAYMTNAGTPVSYAHPMLRSWCTQTKASNTVLVDDVSQHPLANGGRLENWQDRRGFTYLAAISDNYQDLSVRHRRAVLFLRPDYWFVFDRLVLIDRVRKTHDYRWQGHFQPTELSVDDRTKVVATSVSGGKRLYLIPLRPETLELERGKGLIADGVHQMETAVDGPYVRYIQKSDSDVSFGVLVYPTTNDAPTPLVSSLTIQARADGVRTDDALGLRIRHDAKDDVIAVAEHVGLRTYGPLLTDGEAAYVRMNEGKIKEAGIVAGQVISLSGKTILEASSGIESASVEYTADKVMIDARGQGTLSLAAGTATVVVLNGKTVSASENRCSETKRWEVTLSNPGSLDLSTPKLSTDAAAVYKALVGFRPGPSLPPWNPVSVSWSTSLPSDATIEYAPLGSQAWVRTTKPDPVIDHRIVLNRLSADTTYRLRIRSSTEDGRVGRAELTYRCSVAGP